MNSNNIKCFQIYYKDSQRKELDSMFIPYDNSANKYPFNYEYAVFFDLYKKVDWGETSILGSVSWKYYEKTGLSGKKFIKHVENNPGFDVYFVNPFPELSIYKNGWVQGDEYHSHLTELTKILLRTVGYSTEFLELNTPPNLSAYCNFWMGNKKFWDAYLDFLNPIWNYIQTNDNSLTDALATLADPFIKAPYLPFIFERLFSSFLVLHPEIKVSSLEYDYLKIQELNFFPKMSQLINNSNKLHSHDLIKYRDRLKWRMYVFVRRFRYHTLRLWLKKINGIKIDSGLSMKKINALKTEFISHLK